MEYVTGDIDRRGMVYSANNSQRDPPGRAFSLETALEMEQQLFKIRELLSETAGSDEIAANDFISNYEKSFPDALARHEIQVGLIALLLERSGRALTYQDVLKFTDKYSGKAMNITMVYRTIERLVARAVLVEVDFIDSAGSRAKSYRIADGGSDVIRLAVVNARVLAQQQRKLAA
ncbi:hypothetical protein [Rhizobium brockwellii]|uniref:hypothetical protein n=1 Tax=Rhizobium brockwellii TaxID=3019932 RepID=UPI00293DF679|nr:hypothetical protein [Rhizobium brockwellii]MDV4155252.1 hypothetical protein [Rhizobium brockwellii]